MSKVKITIINKGMNELRKSQEVADFIEAEAVKRQRLCGDGYNHDVKQMPTRVISSIYTDSVEAMKDNLKNNTLLGVVK